ncbi:hypothetical protein R3P88_004662 [Salmonella enterica]|uniref:hypothetical protein n=1 Tax=Salmonella enterica TaxID=28901 RepID=UPI000DF06DD2|nr:hypothetical protein DOE63_28825 [Salmonella enterica subsp. diarizonae serovar 59:z10:-]EAP7868213.1 hypothetical protein [Salmonella enterica]EBE3721897.1 hypothetical protein [Salmonella enterica subsp. diarizonae serovar 42:l,v:1,5,7]ECC9264051.1 hypothetical protein [Salmonella enterica subsp. diarizonae]EAQ6248685.1 hypothetical protein [Salmonella enterica]
MLHILPEQISSLQDDSGREPNSSEAIHLLYVVDEPGDNYREEYTRINNQACDDQEPPAREC